MPLPAQAREARAQAGAGFGVSEPTVRRHVDERLEALAAWGAESP